MRLARTLPTILAAVLALAGCGGGGGGSHASGGRGTATLQVVWPKRDTRTVPVNADVVHVVVSKIGSPPIQVDLTRAEAVDAPTGSTTVTEEKIGGLDPGTYQVVATAFSNDAPTRALASGETDGLVIVSGQSTPFVLTMGTELSRFRVSDQSPTPAFTPAVFYIDALGVTSDGTNRVTPTYNSRRTSTELLVTPQSATGSDLLLLPSPPTFGGDDLIVITGDGGLSASFGGSTVGSSYRTTINYEFGRPTVGSLKFDYRDYEDGALVTLKSFVTSVQLKAPSANVDVTFSGLPATFNGSSYRISATLKENPPEVGDADQSPAASYTGIVNGSDPNTATFQNVSDRNRGFKVDAKLEIATDSGGFAQIASLTGAVVDVAVTSDVSFPPGAYATMALATPNASGSTLPAAGVPRNNALIGPDDFSLRVRIGGGSPVLLSPSLFILTLDSGSGATVASGSSIRVASDRSSVDATAVFRAEFVRPTGTVDPVDLGTFSLLVKKNTGIINVGIK